MTVNSAFRRYKQNNEEFRVNLEYLVSLSQPRLLEAVSKK